ncbi:MAG: glycosyltransferase [Candidatus Heimdallarchaeaceae archaeon]|jgi:cellulose synthase/poly-beta-1,6-N-acetylglucosamine synthase-like glycosyltransferase
MKWKKVLWYSLTILLLGFLTYYIIFSTIHIITTFSRTDAIWKQVITLICNFLILLAELFSAFYSVFIYYFIGSSSNYKIIKDEKNSFLTQDPLPKVVVAIPLYKEPLAVVSETIKGALQIDYPKDRFEVVVLDDSPPEHSKDIELFCKEKGVGFVQRKSRKGFKAGAINNFLKQIKCDFFSVLDSDHIPTPNFIRTCLSGFVSDDIVLVQGKPMFVNQDDYLMRSSAYIHTQFFHIYQKSRGTRGGVIFAGTTGMFRADLLKKFGGFYEDTLAEDTDTSFGLMSEGYKTSYIHEVCSKGLVPWNPISMVNQVWRWTNGITAIFRKRLFKILKGKNSFINKIDILSTVSTPIIGVLIWFVNLLLYIMYKTGIEFLRPDLAQRIPLLLLAPLLISLASMIMALVAWRREEKEDRMIRLRGFFGMSWTIGAFYLLMLTAQSFLIWAVLSALFGVKKDFDRTVKEKSKTMGKMSQKLKYTIWSLGLLVLAVFYYIASWETWVAGNTLSGWFIIAAISITIPIIITITHFRKLDLMRKFAATKTAADVEKEYEE